MSVSPEVVLWIRAMARMRARAGSIAQEVGVSIAEARRIYKEEIGKSSPSGQNPGSIDWYLKTTHRKFQSALLLQLYAITTAKMDSRFAFANAYYHFSRMMAYEWKGPSTRDPAMRDDEDDYSFPYQRGQFLVNYYSDNVGLNGRRVCDLALRRCNTCRSIFLTRTDDLENNCPVCLEKSHKS